MLPFLHLHGIAQRTGGPRDDGDLGHRGGMALQGGHQGVPDFMVGDNHFFLVGQHFVFLLVSCDHHFYALFHIPLGYKLPPFPYRPQCRFVHHIGKLRTGSPGGYPGNGIKINVIPQLYLFRMHL